MTDQLDRLKTALADRYAIEREIGRGGMATVYLAEDSKHRRPVAIKVLDPELAHALGAGRFLREVEVTAKLTHPHILTLIDSGEADGFLYYVMPYIEGETLRERMSREGQLPLDDALQVTRDVAAALSCAHSHGVIHRDVKPENILLSAGEAVVADFGIARAISEAGGEHLTETGISIGTPAYMSPEQATADHQLDGRSDIYSLGCVLYEMLVGEPPHTGPTAQALLAKKLSEPTPRVSLVREMVPEAIDLALVRAMAKAPADRFATAERFVEALTSEQVDRTAPPTRAARRATVAVLITIATVALVVIVALLAWPRSQQPARPPRLVVLPFENLGPPEDEYFADGMTDAITARIANMAGLQVISRASAVQYKNTDKTPMQIGEELGVGYLLEGTVQRERPGDPTSRVRIFPKLIDVSTDAHLWAGTFDENMTELFRVQSGIAEQVASVLEVRILGVERQAVVARPTASQEAYDAYLHTREPGLGDVLPRASGGTRLRLCPRVRSVVSCLRGAERHLRRLGRMDPEGTCGSRASARVGFGVGRGLRRARRCTVVRTVWIPP